LEQLRFLQNLSDFLYFIGFFACFNPSHSGSIVAFISWKLTHFVENWPEVPRNPHCSQRMKTARRNPHGLLTLQIV